MTNWEKFKEIFGIPQSTTIEPDCYICDILDCSNVSCSSCPINKMDMNNVIFWYEEYEERVEKIKIGDKVRTLTTTDKVGNILFPIGTIGEVTCIDNDDDELPYQVEANNTRWWYSRDMLEVIEREE